MSDLDQKLDIAELLARLDWALIMLSIWLPDNDDGRLTDTHRYFEDSKKFAEKMRAKYEIY